ncbi:hypothetical protein T4B_14359 [Trichinella pseudospiralis]|uniref:DUF5641 domain-containing protein n=1 Tax=Trichinella pseudospiralis TaxID=6337 RepID=A0A0V1IHK7_TRIPS|nr:hypothetical protein T4B_14359 [Trichinella pseudospiralis]KRZ30339.1 hypothetical protein T4C_4338 [Trichinella pseudospiralis]
MEALTISRRKRTYIKSQRERQDVDMKMILAEETIAYQQKWTAQRTESKIANIVLVCEDNENRNSRPLRRILQLYPGPDGIIQSVRVKTAARSFARLIRKLWLIEGATWRWDSSIAGRYKRQNDKLYCTTTLY